ncbi:MAG: nitrilase-related carbon-nitrogen hydrolase [Caldilineaceae bacterium]
MLNSFSFPKPLFRPIRAALASAWWWAAAHPPVAHLWQRYWANSVEVPGPITAQSGAAARAANAYVVMGVIERDSQTSRGTLYCTLLYFGPDGRLLGKHRKLKPTGAERLIWGEGDAGTLTVIDSDFGKVGGLICWENYMPLGVWLCTPRASRFTWRPRQTPATPGRLHCATLPAKDAALCWAATSL